MIMADEISTLMANSRDKVVLLRLRNKRSVHGKLKDFDIHMNLTLEDAEDISDEKPVKIGAVLLRGDNILAISLPEDKE